MIKLIYSILVCASILLAATPNKVVPKAEQSSSEIAAEQLNQIENRLTQYESDSVERYQRIASELDRDLSWIAIVVAVFSLFSGVVVPFIINAGYRKQLKEKIEEQEKAYEAKVGELNVKLKDFSEEYSTFKKNYEISSLFEQIPDLEDDTAKIEIYSKILSIDPNNRNALLRRGICYRHNNQFPEALADFNRMISLDSSDVIGYSNLGYTYYEASDLHHAKEQYDKALAINPVYPTCLYRMAIALFDENRFPDALTYIDRALNESPDKISYHARRRRILRKIDPVDRKAIDAETDIINKLEEERGER